MMEPQQQKAKRDIPAPEVDLVQAMRDMTSEFLRKLEDFSHDYFARLDRLEHSKRDRIKRLKRLEERIVALETSAKPAN
jgi:DNA invertase Pin-like site-specific DNA recombinase